MVRPFIIVLVSGLVGFAVARFTAPVSSAKPNAALAKAPPAASIPPGTAAALQISSSAPVGPPLDPRVPTSITGKLSDVLRTSNYFKSAESALAIIDAMTPEDFRELSEKPSHFPTPSDYGFDKKFHTALMDAVIARWLLVDPSGAPAAIRQIEDTLKKERMAGAGIFIAALARLKPQAILDAMPERTSWGQFDSTIPNALTSLAARDPTAARRYLERITDPELRKPAELAIAMGMARNDPISAVSVAHTMNSPDVFQAALLEAERIGPGILRQALAANAGKIPIGNRLMELVFRYPEEDWPAYMSGEEITSLGVSPEAREEAGRLTPEKRARLFEQIERMPIAMHPKATEALLFSWARQEPQAALEWAMAHATPTDPDAPETKQVGAAFFPWMRSDEAAAVEWWSQLPDSPLRVLLGNGVAEITAGRLDFETAVTLFRPKPDSETARIIGIIARAGAEVDPARAAKWLDSLPPEVDTSKAVAIMLEKWISHDPVAAARWVERQPVGPRRDAVVEAYTSEAADFDPVTAGEWAATISDPHLRLVALEYVFRAMNRSDPVSARTWLRALPGADSVWCERIIRLQL